MSNPQEPNAKRNPTPPEVDNETADQAAPKPNIVKRNSDQLFMAVVGFILISVLGAFLSNWWEASRLSTTRQIEQERRETEARITAFTEFFGTVSEQQARSALVDEAFKNRAPIQDLAVLLRSEQEMYAKSQNKTGVLTFTIRELVAPATYERIRSAMDSGLIKPLDESIRLHTFIYYQILNNPKSSDWKNIAGLSRRLGTCSSALTHAIWYNAIAPQSTDQAFMQKKEDSLRHIDEVCKDVNR